MKMIHFTYFPLKIGYDFIAASIGDQVRTKNTLRIPKIPIYKVDKLIK